MPAKTIVLYDTSINGLVVLWYCLIESQTMHVSNAIITACTSPCSEGGAASCSCKNYVLYWLSWQINLYMQIAIVVCEFSDVITSK